MTPDQSFEIPQETFNKQVAVVMALQDALLETVTPDDEAAQALTTAIHGLTALQCPMGFPVGDPVGELESYVDERIEAALTDDKGADHAAR